jgi:sulfur relay protein TusB/DsrH
LYEQLAFASKGDAILLLEDGVLSLQSPLALASFIAKCKASGIEVFALEDDCRLRGVSNQYPQISLLNYSGFVALVVEHDKQVAW